MKDKKPKSDIDKYFDRKDRLKKDYPELPIITKICLFFEIEPEDLRKELSLLVFGGETKKADDDMMPKIKVELLKKHSSLFHYGTMTDEKAYADVIGWLVKEGILKMDINQTAEGIELIWSIIDRGE